MAKRSSRATSVSHAAKRAAERRKRQRRTTSMWAGLGGVALILIGIAGWYVWDRSQDEGDDGFGEVINYFDVGNVPVQHIQPPGAVLYEQIPPVGGPHWTPTNWQNCGFYSGYIPNEAAVHSLEHGAVWITYRPDLPQDQIDLLKAKTTTQQYLLVSPYPGISAPVIASAWGKQEKFKDASDTRIDQFISDYAANPENSPEPGAACWLGRDATTDQIPQQTPYEAPDPDAKVFGGVIAADLTPEAEQTPTIVPAATEPIAAATPVATPINVPSPSTPIATPVATPSASPVATPPATPSG